MGLEWTVTKELVPLSLQKELIIAVKDNLEKAQI